MAMATKGTLQYIWLQVGYNSTRGSSLDAYIYMSFRKDVLEYAQAAKTFLSYCLFKHIFFINGIVFGWWFGYAAILPTADDKL